MGIRHTAMGVRAPVGRIVGELFFFLVKPYCSTPVLAEGAEQ